MADAMPPGCPPTTHPPAAKAKANGHQSAHAKAAHAGKMTAAQDDAYDRAHHIVENSPADRTLDAQRGVK